jgi:hypothetical protein
MTALERMTGVTSVWLEAEEAALFVHPLITARRTTTTQTRRMARFLFREKKVLALLKSKFLSDLSLFIRKHLTNR